MGPGTALETQGTQAELSSNLFPVTLLKPLGFTEPQFLVNKVKSAKSVKVTVGQTK